MGHHPRQGRGYQRTHPRKDRDERERERKRDSKERERERRDVAWQHTHPCRGTPPQAKTWCPAHAPPKGQRWERERERKKERRDVAWQHTHPCRGTPPQARTWLPAHAPPKGQRWERERGRERERGERKKGRGVATHAPLPWDTTPGKDVVTSARTPERIERERKRERQREREKEREIDREIERDGVSAFCKPSFALVNSVKTTSILSESLISTKFAWKHVFFCADHPFLKADRLFHVVGKNNLV